MSTRVLYQVPKRAHFELIGRGGSNIKRLTQTYSVKINIPSSEDSSTTISVSGSVENVKKVKEEMETILGYEIGTEKLNKVYLEISPSSFGSLIGKGGATLRTLENASNCNIYIPRDEDKVQLVEVEGPGKATDVAIAEIGKLLKHAPKVVSGVSEAKAAPVVKIDLTQPIHESLFFPDDSLEDGWNFDRFLCYLRCATKTLDICVFTLSDDRVTRVLEQLFDKGVKIRIITDNDTSTNQGSDIQELKKVGIPIKMDKTEFHMHHKFAVVDKKLLINGSYNWTSSASVNNQENIMITNQKEFVEDFSNHFEKMWNNKDAFE